MFLSHKVRILAETTNIKTNGLKKKKKWTDVIPDRSIIRNHLETGMGLESDQVVGRAEGGRFL